MRLSGWVATTHLRASPRPSAPSRPAATCDPGASASESARSVGQPLQAVSRARPRGARAQPRRVQELAPEAARTLPAAVAHVARDRQAEVRQMRAQLVRAPRSRVERKQRVPATGGELLVLGDRLRGRRPRPPSAGGPAGPGRSAPRSGRAGPAPRRAPARGTPSRRCGRRTGASGWPAPHRSWRRRSGRSSPCRADGRSRVGRRRRSSRAAHRDRAHDPSSAFTRVPVRVPGRRMHDQPGRLVDDQHRRRPRRRHERDRLRDEGLVGRRAELDADPLSPARGGRDDRRAEPSTSARPSQMSRWACARLMPATARPRGRPGRRAPALDRSIRHGHAAGSLTRVASRPRRTVR